MRQRKIPIIRRGALIVAIRLRGSKELRGLKSSGPISPLSVSFKIFERLIYACVEPIIDPLLRQQACFRYGKLTVGQVTLLTQDIKDSFFARKKAGTEFVDLTAV